MTIHVIFAVYADCDHIAVFTYLNKTQATVILSLKVGARVMITKDINVSDGLTNGVMGTVTDIVLDKTTAIVKTILVKFDYESIGQEVCSVIKFVTKK